PSAGIRREWFSGVAFPETPMRVRLAAIPVLLVMAALRPTSARAQQSDVSFAPFVALPTSSHMGTSAGLGLTLAGSPGFGLRVAGRMALKNTAGGVVGPGTWMPPW